jgi:hypothetical protein
MPQLPKDVNTKNSPPPRTEQTIPTYPKNP